MVRKIFAEEDAWNSLFSKEEGFLSNKKTMVGTIPLQRASGSLFGMVVSSGDSDSIACLTGAFAGAYHGLAAWPAEWIARVERREQLARLGNAWDR